MLGELGVDGVVAYPTNREFLSLGARDFFQRIVQEALGARALVEGPDFHFGRGRAGNVELLGQLCAEAGMGLEIVDPVLLEDEPVSSSRVRRLLAEGNVEGANHLLGRPYRIRGVVGRGAARGSGLGYPTANLEKTDTLLPGEGIFAGRAYVQGESWPTALSLGPNPTFDEHHLKIEAFLLAFEGNLYNKPIEVDFLARLRDIVRFASPEQLVVQMDQDVRETQRIVEAFTEKP
jgi:riboflavin kinase/FMN adenylyltransferase